jgi:lysozyme C
MGKLSLIFLILLSVHIQQYLAKTFSRSELSTVLQQNGLSSIDDWLCLVEHESSFTTSKTNKNRNKSTDYGLFQINNGFWCKNGKAGGDCKIDCSNLLDDDITDDIKCAKLIHRRHGFNAWYGWKNHCQGLKKAAAPSKPKTSKKLTSKSNNNNAVPSKPKASKSVPSKSKKSNVASTAANKKPAQTKAKKKTRS